MDAMQFRYVFMASDFDESVEFYRDKLGFKIVDGWDRPEDHMSPKGAFASAGGNSVVEIISRASKEAADPPRPSGCSLAVEVGDVDGYYEEVIARGVTPRNEPFDAPWGHRGFAVVDPDGMVIMFFSQIEGVS